MPSHPQEAFNHVDAAPTDLASRFLDGVRTAVRDAPALLPDELFNTFEFTRTGRNFSHPRVWGACVKAAWAVSSPGCIVEVDPRLNAGGGAKFQPDVLVRALDGSVRLAVDVESPNSSDARLLPKDVDAYVDWVRRSGCAPFPYVVLTMLPRDARTATQWKPRWLESYNAGSASHVGEILRSPFDYWYGLLVHDAALVARYPITFANFDGREVSAVDLRSVPAGGSHVPAGCPTFTDAELTPLLGAGIGKAKASAAMLVAERVAQWLAPGERSSATPWPSKATPSSVWSYLGHDCYVGIDWPEDGVAGLSVWKRNAYAWPGKGPALFSDMAGLRSRVARLATWWGS